MPNTSLQQPYVSLKNDALLLITYDVVRNSNAYQILINQHFDKSCGKTQKVYFKYKSVILQNNTQMSISLYDIATMADTSHLEDLVDSYEEEFELLRKVNWYVKRILNEADSLYTAQFCIPTHLHKYLKSIDFYGDKSSDYLKIQELYDALEEAPLKSTLLNL